MLGTLSLIGLFVAGIWHAPLWILIPFTVLNSFIGVHFPSWKAQRLKEDGTYWRTLIGSSPLQLVFAAIVFGVGYGIGVLFA